MTFITHIRLSGRTLIARAFDPQERGITHLRAENGGVWTLENSIAVINGGTPFSTLAPDGSSSPIRVVGTAPNQYLRTEADGDAPDNLLNLPKF